MTEERKVTQIDILQDLVEAGDKLAAAVKKFVTDRHEGMFNLDDALLEYELKRWSNELMTKQKTTEAK